MLKRIRPDEINWSGLIELLESDTDGPKVGQIANDIRNGVLTPWQYDDVGVSVQFLVQLTDSGRGKEATLAYSWGHGLVRARERVVEAFKEVMRPRGIKYLCATFRSWAMFKKSGANLDYVLGSWRV